MASARLALAVAVCSLQMMSTGAEPASPDKIGVAIGQKAPDFSLKDQNDGDVSLAGLLKKSPVALVFFRSAEW